MSRKTGEIEVNGATLRYDVSGEGEPLVLVHAGIADLRMWDGQFEAFARRYRTHRHDMRGFGGSAMVGGPYAHHEDLRGLLDTLEVGKARFVGCSMGAKTILDFALAYPERVERLVLVGPAVSGFEYDAEPPRQWDEILAADEVGDLERISELEVQIWIDGPRRGPEAVDPAVRDLVGEMNLIALQNEELNLGEELPLDPPAANRLTELHAPTLVIVGDQDQPRTLASADLLEKNLPNAKKVVMPDTAHLPNMERPEEFNRMVLDFLEKRTP